MSEQQDNQQDKQQNIIEEKITKSNGDQIIKKYIKGRILGKGGFAKCYEVTSLDSKKILAAKIIPKQTLIKNRARSKLISEIKIHKSLFHYHVVLFEHVFEDSENVYILLELCPNNTLNEYLKKHKRLNEQEVISFVNQMLKVLKYLHSNRVIHRDLKLGNLFLNHKLEIKLGDFGLATKLEHVAEKKHTICGTPNYIAPEILDGKTGHSFQVDIWSLGVIIYTLLVGKPPFETPDVKTTYKRIRQNQYSFPENMYVSDTAKDLIMKILVLDPSKRLNLEEIESHPFMNQQSNIMQGLSSSTSYKQFLTQQKILLPNNEIRGKVQTLSASKTQGKPWALVTSTNWLQKKEEVRPSTQNLKGQQMQQVQSMKNISNNNYFMQTKTSLTNKKNDEGVWVSLWVDYSSKYGLGYLLSNGNNGVVFNDLSKIILDNNTNNFEYIENNENIQEHNLKDYPQELKKKVTLLVHFKSFLAEQSKKNIQTGNSQMKSSNLEIQIQKGQQQYIYVKKWMKTKHAILFRLSNKLVQVAFNDKTEILLSVENKMITYVDMCGYRTNYPLQSAQDSTNIQMVKRLKYTKEIIGKMLNNSKDLIKSDKENKN